MKTIILLAIIAMSSLGIFGQSTYDTYSNLTLSERRAKLNSESPKDKARLWIESIERNSKELQLSIYQEYLVSQIILNINEYTIENPKSLEYFEELFAKEFYSESKKIFTSVGSLKPKEGLTKLTYEYKPLMEDGLNNACEHNCSIGSSWNVSCNNECHRVSGCTTGGGCGFLGNYNCDGLCYVD